MWQKCFNLRVNAVAWRRWLGKLLAEDLFPESKLRWHRFCKEIFSSRIWKCGIILSRKLFGQDVLRWHRSCEKDTSWLGFVLARNLFGENMLMWCHSCEKTFGYWIAIILARKLFSEDMLMGWPSSEKYICWWITDMAPLSREHFCSWHGSLLVRKSCVDVQSFLQEASWAIKRGIILAKTVPMKSCWRGTILARSFSRMFSRSWSFFVPSSVCF